MSGEPKTSVLFICLGNICRSPIGEAVFQHLVKQRGLQSQFRIDSAATAGYHVGNSPDPRAMKVLKEKGVEYRHTVRKVTSDDFREFDYIFGMDNENISNLKRVEPNNSKAKIELLGSYDPEGEILIRDPYYDDDDEGFYKCYEQCVRDCNAFLDKLLKK